MPDGAASQRGEGSQDPGSGGGEGRPRSLLRPRNPTTGRAADDRILSVREGESPAVPSRPSIVLYFGGLSFSSPSVLPTLPMHTQTPPNRLSSMGTLEPLSTQPTRWRTAWSINPKGHPLSLPLKSLSAEGQTVLSGGTFSEVPEETTQDNPNGQQDGQRAAGSGQQTDRSRPIGRCARPQRRFGIWPLVPNEMSQRRGSTRVNPDTRHNCLDGFISAIFTSIVRSQRQNTEHDCHDTGRCRSRSGNDLGHEVGGRPWLQRPSQNARDSARPAELTLGGMGAASRASVSAPSSTGWHRGRER